MKYHNWTIDENSSLYENWEYFTKNKEIAKNTFSCSWDAIRIHACSLGVGKINHFKSNPAILNEARDYFDGLVLGDGHIFCKNSKTGYYHQRCKHKNWLDKISEDLYEYEIECSVDNGRLYTGGFNIVGGSIAFELWTRSYIEFKEMYDRFYIKWYDIDNHSKTRWHMDEDGEYFIWQKVVPKDIRLSPACLANEYLGDGSTSKRTYENGYTTLLSTNDFLREDIIFLADLLSDVLDIKCGITKRGVIEICTQADISTFLNYIKDYKVDCYKYKFPEILIGDEIK